MEILNYVCQRVSLTFSFNCLFIKAICFFGLSEVRNMTAEDASCSSFPLKAVVFSLAGGLFSWQECGGGRKLSFPPFTLSCEQTQ